MNTFYRLLILSFVLNCSFFQTVSAAIVDSLELPIAAFDTFQHEICQQQELIIYNQSTNYENVIWEISGNHSLELLSTGNARIIYYEEGIFDVTLIASNECGSDTLTKEGYFTVFKQPEAYIETVLIDDDCVNGQTFDLYVTSPDSIVSYHWWNYQCYGSNDSSYCRQNFSFREGGNNVSVRLTDTNGCVTEAYITIYTPETQNITLTYGSNLNSVCEGNEFDSSSLGVKCYPPECTVYIDSLNTDITGERIVNVYGEYKGCTTSIGVTVYVVAKLNLSIIDSITCIGDYTPFNANFGDTFPYSPRYYANGVEIGMDTFFIPDSAGLYAITGLDNGFGNGCLSNDTIYIRAIESPTFTLNYKQDICRNTEEFVTIKIEDIIGTPPYSYQWWINATAIETDTNVLILPLSELPNDSYSVRSKITHANGCASQEQSANFTIDICDNISSHPSNQFSIYQINAEQLLLKLDNIIGGKINARIYNLSGQTLLEQAFFPSNSTLEEIISIQNINSGLYILQLKAANEKVFSQKIWIK